MVSVDLESASFTMGVNGVAGKISSESSESADLDQALVLTGYGRFHFNVVACCAFCLISSGLQNSLSAYVLPAARCELFLESAEIGIINAAFLIGGTCSSFLWGVMADLTGRKKLLAYTLLLDVATTVICCLMQEFIGLVVCRFVSGFLIGAPGSITFSYLSEFHGPRHRAKSIYYSGVFFSLSWLLLPIIAWLILSISISFRVGNFVFLSSWRIFLALLTIPELIGGIWMFFLPESPKYLATKDSKKALDVLRKMYARNKSKSESDFPVKKLLHAKVWTRPSHKVNCRGKVARIIQGVVKQVSRLLKAPLLKITLVISGIFFANMFGYFGLGLWLPEFLARFQEFENSYPNRTTTLRRLANVSTSSNESCSVDFDTDLFQNTLAMGVSSLVGNFISGYFAGRFHHKVIPLASMLIGAVSSASIYWARSTLQGLIASCFFQSSMTIANVAIGSVVVELFPTSVNAIAICTAMFAGRVGAILSNVVFGFVMDYNCEIGIFVVAGVLLAGTVLCLLIPSGQDEEDCPNSESKNKNEVSVISVSSM